MNPTPCVVCNNLIERKTLAFIRSEWHEFRRLFEELADHQVKCHVINGGWYLGLWSNARVGTDTEQVKP